MASLGKEQKTKESELLRYSREGNLMGLIALHPSSEKINEKNERGYTALMLAAVNGHEDMVKYLLACGGDPNSKDYRDNSILMKAAFKGHLPVVELLVSHGADIDAVNAKNQSALNYAQMFCRSDVAVYLKAKVNKPQHFSMLDILRGWHSYLFKRKRARF